MNGEAGGDQSNKFNALLVELLRTNPVVGPLLISGFLFGGFSSVKLTTADTSDRIHRATVVEWRAEDRKLYTGWYHDIDERVHSLEDYRIQHTATTAKHVERIDRLVKAINPKPHEEVNRELRDLRDRMHDLELEVQALEKRQ